MQVLRYLGRYTHRVAISNHRLLACEQERVTFRWKDYAHRGKQGQMTLAATEFLRRFFLHELGGSQCHLTLLATVGVILPAEGNALLFAGQQQRVTFRWK